MTPELAERLRGKTVVASISGGKDSTAMALWFKEQGVETVNVFADTGFEDEETYEYVRGPLTETIGPIEEVRAPLGMVDLIRKKGTFPSRQRRWCTEELKLKPICEFVRAMEDAHQLPVVAVGIRDEESNTRKAMPEWEWSDFYDCEMWRPIKTMTLDDVKAIHARHGLKPNPRYLQGATRVGCRLCVQSRKGGVREVADNHPETIALIAQLEKELTGRAGEQRGWFQSPLARSGVWPIEEIVRWSRTTHGGRQLDLLPRDEREGCMRWGLCDTGDES